MENKLDWIIIGWWQQSNGKTFWNIEG